MPRILLEACVDTLRSCVAAASGGADRLELCDNLSDGGTTPSAGLVGMALERVGIPVFPIVRVRGGGFVYDDDEREAMLRDLAHFRTVGAPGAVIGALTEIGTIDRTFVARCQDIAGTMSLTFHRAFDVTRDPSEALEMLIALGIPRVLTSGAAPTAWEGRTTLAELVDEADAHITVMAGGGIREEHVAELVEATRVREVHVRGTMPWRDAREWDAPAIPFRRALPDDELLRWETDPVRIAAIRAALTTGTDS
ncbi:MAG TPA: copper homeostasis protein CutC [Gemmatimonadales bacterium]|nr:copper homeostasis protein CutC [Gemmatimonadales bacterium]